MQKLNKINDYLCQWEIESMIKIHYLYDRNFSVISTVNVAWFITNNLMPLVKGKLKELLMNNNKKRNYTLE